MDLRAKVCLITGGTKGIGAATALALAGRGARIALVSRRLDETAKQTLQRIEKISPRALFIAADVGKPDEATRRVEQTAAQLGDVDVLVHAAGGGVVGGLFELSAAAWESAFAVHVHAIFHLCRAAIPAMRRKKQGCIVLISSGAGLRGLKRNVAYQTAKGALPQLARAIAFEFADDNIRAQLDMCRSNQARGNLSFSLACLNEPLVQLLADKIFPELATPWYPPHR